MAKEKKPVLTFKCYVCKEECPLTQTSFKFPGKERVCNNCAKKYESCIGCGKPVDKWETHCEKCR